jgi:sigma-B regulation protein RsbU (phosphoserine phosphatase)
LTSDGVIEANNAAGEMFGFEQWEEVIKTGPTHSAEALLDHLKQVVLAFMGEAEQHDDITIVVAQI